MTENTTEKLQEIMQKIDDQFLHQMRNIGSSTNTSNTHSDDQVFSLEKLMAAIRDIPPPPPSIRYSEYATALPSAKPKTLDMQMLVEMVGQRRVPAAFKMKDYLGREMIVAHPDLLPQNKTRGWHD